MPIYDYHCDQCGHTFSAVQSYADATLEVCPSCGKKPRKLMATPAIVFKGGGWYKTDSRVAPKDGSDGAPSKGAPASGGDAAKSDAAKSDAPPATAGPVTADAPKSQAAAPAKKSESSSS